MLLVSSVKIFFIDTVLFICRIFILFFVNFYLFATIFYFFSYNESTFSFITLSVVILVALKYLLLIPASRSPQGYIFFLLQMYNNLDYTLYNVEVPQWRFWILLYSTSLIFCCLAGNQFFKTQIISSHLDICSNLHSLFLFLSRL